MGGETESEDDIEVALARQSLHYSCRTLHAYMSNSSGPFCHSFTSMAFSLGQISCADEFLFVFTGQGLWF